MTKMTEEALERRLIPMEERLVRIDRDIQTSNAALATLEASQAHMRELFDTKLKSIEKSQDLIVSKVDQLTNSLTLISSEINKSPLGRALMDHINDVEAKVNNQRSILDNIISWQNNIEGVLKFWKFVGAAGIIALIIQVSKAIVSWVRMMP